MVKKKLRGSRFLAAFLAAVMVATSVEITAFASEGNPSLPQTEEGEKINVSFNEPQTESDDLLTEGEDLSSQGSVEQPEVDGGELSEEDAVIPPPVLAPGESEPAPAPEGDSVELPTVPPEIKPEEEETIPPEEIVPEKEITISAIAEDLLLQTVPFGTGLEKLILPEQLETRDSEQGAAVISVTWSSQPEYDGQTAGEYHFTPVLPDGYIVAEGTTIPMIQVVVEQADVLEQEKKVVSILPLESSVSRQEVKIGTQMESLQLPEQLEAVDTEKNPIMLSVNWECNPEFDGTVSGGYVFTPVLSDGFVAAEGTELPTIEVVVLEDAALLADQTSLSVSTPEEFERAIEQIKADDKEEYTILLAADINLTSDFTGVPGKLVTVSSKDTPCLLTFAEDVLELSGPLTFEKIHITPHTIYANGYSLVLGDGFGGGTDGDQRMTVYGGSSQDLTADTNITVLDGVYKLIAGGNSAGTLTGNTHVKFGGNACFPTAADGKLEGDYSTGSSAGYNLYQKAEMESSWNPVLISYTRHGVLPYGIYGGGINSDTTGETSVEMTGGTVYQIFGGGAAIWNPNYAKPQHKNGGVDGDTYVTVTGGEVKSIYGGGYNGIDAFGGDDYEKVPDDARSTRAVVGGTAHVTITGDACVPACEQSEDASTSGCDPAAVHGGSFHSTVSAAEVIVDGNARIETGGAEGTGYGYGSLFGAGTNDVVLGTTSVTLQGNACIGRDDNELGASVISQGYFGNMTPLGYATQSGCYIGGAQYNYGSEIRNQDKAQYAATALVNGGQVDVLSIGPKSRLTKQAKKSVQGDVLFEQTGGTVAAIEASCINNKNVTVAGNVDVKVSGGNVTSYIMGRYPSMNDDDKTITGTVNLEFSGSSPDTFLRIPLIETMDHVTVKSGSRIAIMGSWRCYDYVGKYTKTGKAGLVTEIPFFQVKGLTVEPDAVLALTQKGLIEGDIAVNGQLNLQRSNGIFGGLGAEVKAPLTAEGIAAGTGLLLPFEKQDFGTGSVPKSGEEYVYAKQNGSSMKLTLANAGATGLYVDRKSKTAEQDIWYIAKQTPQEVTVTFDKNGGDTEADPKQKTVISGSAVGTLPTAPTRKNYTFLGWNTEANGSGTEFTAATPVTSNITVYAQWDKAEKQLWYYELYYQSYSPEGSQVDENGVAYDWIRQTYGQGGWAYPDDAVSISRTKFDGKEFAWEAIDGSGKETLGVHYVYDETYGPHRLSSLCGEATKGNPLKIYYRATPHTVTYQYDGVVPSGAPTVPEVVHTSYSAPVAVAAAPTLEGYKFSGWTVKSPNGTQIENGKLTMPNNDVVLVGTWSKIATPIEPVRAVYKVEHYKQQDDGTYALAETEFPLFGDIGKTVQAVPKSYPDFSVNTEKSILSGTVVKPETVDGKLQCLVLKVYYQQNPKMGNLSVTKYVTGSRGDHQRSFPIQVALQGEKGIAVNGIFGDMTFANGVASFTLKDNESKIAKGLPAGLEYVVTETDSYGHAQSYTGQTGTIPVNGTAQASITNHKSGGGGGGSSHDDNEINVTVKNVWKLDDGWKAPKSIRVELLRNGKHYDWVTLSEENHWRYTWRDLKDYYSWSVREDEVPKGFDSRVSHHGNTWTITNNDIPIKDNPSTGR